MLETLKKEVCKANQDLVKHGLVKLTWGNVSGVDRQKGLVVIKPSGVEYAALKPNDMVVVDLAGKVVEGKLKPSSDTPTHLVLYKAWPAIGGITHTHSTHATMFAQSGRGIPCLGTTHADTFYGEIPVTRTLKPDDVEGDYEANTGTVIVERFTNLNPDDMPAVLVADHAPFTWGADAADAVEHAVILEEVARMAVGTLLISKGIPLVPQYLLDRHYKRKHGPKAYYGQDRPSEF
jgi:L-ribulose-5-phosphate 4-epimerase